MTKCVAAKEDDAVAVSPLPLLPVLVARELKSVWHVSLGTAIRPNPEKSACRVEDDPMRVATAKADKDLMETMRAECLRLNCVGVLVDPSAGRGRRFVAFCPDHGEIGRNTTEEFACERVVSHAEIEHSGTE